jgi:very-short-patch-repair endonuclease
VVRALSGRKPRVPDLTAAVEIEQLCLAINRTGLVLLFAVDGAQVPAAALVHALEWISQNAHVAVAAVFVELPDDAPPFDRILHGAIRIAQSLDLKGSTPLEEEPASDGPWLAPVRGIPHPLSKTEQRLAKALSRDAELAPLFGFNQFVDTIRGSRPKVDLLWTAGQLVVELDGYADHGTRGAFVRDRHRDYELMLTGYAVLRLANEEIAQDIQKAVEKIRDMVQLCRARAL